MFANDETSIYQDNVITSVDSEFDLFDYMENNLKLGTKNELIVAWLATWNSGAQITNV